MTMQEIIRKRIAASVASEKGLENLKRYEEALSGMPLYENAEETHEINI